MMLPPGVVHVGGALSGPSGDYDADVIILSLERAAETEAAIRSALMQEGVERHVFVVDQGSGAETLARLAAVVEGRGDATLVRVEQNLGVAGGRNVATSLGRGRVIVALDNDAEFDDCNTLACSVAAIDEDREVAAIGFRILVDGTGVDDLLSWGYPKALLPGAAETFGAVTFVGAGHAIRRDAWEEAGGYDARLFFCWEEFDFCLRAIERGWQVQYRGDIVVRHKVSAERRVAWSGDRWFHFVRNRLYIARKWGAHWPSLAPRCAAYVLKGMRNGLLCETFRAIVAARNMSARARGEPLSRPTRVYLAQHDTAFRGGLVRRVRCEVLASLQGPHCATS
jgi:GT2 family glycosyltransferase